MRSRLRVWHLLLFATAIGCAITTGVYFLTPPSAKIGPDGRWYDPIEDDPVASPLIQKADEEAREQLKDSPMVMGWCHGFWKLKKQILKEKYGIEWRTPKEMNPGVAFD